MSSSRLHEFPIEFMKTLNFQRTVGRKMRAYM